MGIRVSKGVVEERDNLSVVVFFRDLELEEVGIVYI